MWQQRVSARWRRKVHWGTSSNSCVRFLSSCGFVVKLMVLLKNMMNQSWHDTHTLCWSRRGCTMRQVESCSQACRESWGSCEICSSRVWQSEPFPPHFKSHKTSCNVRISKSLPCLLALYAIAIDRQKSNFSSHQSVVHHMWSAHQGFNVLWFAKVTKNFEDAAKIVLARQQQKLDSLVELNLARCGDKMCKHKHVFLCFSIQWVLNCSYSLTCSCAAWRQACHGKAFWS